MHGGLFKATTNEIAVCSRLGVFIVLGGGLFRIFGEWR